MGTAFPLLGLQRGQAKHVRIRVKSARRRRTPYVLDCAAPEADDLAVRAIINLLVGAIRRRDTHGEVTEDGWLSRPDMHPEGTAPFRA